MTVRHSLIAMSAAAFLFCPTGIVNAQTPPDTTPPADKTTTVTRDDDGRWGWLGLLGLIGLAGLMGRDRYDRTRTTTRP
jgi:MYXO-CTERM domain-containing protein